MQIQEIPAETHLRSYLPQSIAATIFMLGLPIAVVWVSSRFLYFELYPAAALFASLALSLICALSVSRIWEYRVRKLEISFSELMIWSWYRLQKAERRLERGLREAETAETHDEQIRILNGLTAALESKDPYTRGHSRRVERHSFKIGVAMGLPLEDVEVVRMSASLHDVGKIRIPNYLLHKRGRLTDAERALIEEHCVRGSEMVACIGDKRIVETVRHHHERWDGNGYPDGMAGAEIPIFARVIAVADSYDAIRSTRSYRVGAGRDKAVRELRRESGHQFDPAVVDAFLRTLPAKSSVVATLESVAPGPAILWRHLAQLSRRFGSTAFAPTLGAVGTAIIFGSFTPLPPVGPVQAPSISEVSITRSELGAIAPSGPWAAIGPASDIDPNRKNAQVRAERHRTDRSDGRKKSRSPRRSSPDSQTSQGTSRISSPNNGTSPEPSRPSEVIGGVGLGPVGDPNVNGRDCERGLGEASKGSLQHCG